MQEVLHSRRVIRQITIDNKSGMSVRRVRGAISMAIIGLVSLYVLRARYDPAWFISAEVFSLLAGLAFCWWLQLRNATSRLATVFAYSLAIVCCWVLDHFMRTIGYGNGTEMLILTSFGWMSLVISYIAKTPRQLGLSVVCSGFLVLFITSLSDSGISLLPASIYGILCLWWLVANHWEKIASTAVVNVQRPNWLRLNTLLSGIVVTGLIVYFGVTRVPAVRKLTYELMPTSGGTTYSDPAARTGIGNGEALVAARNHAASFGNVDTNLFVDAPEPSLYDLFSEQYGIPRVKKKFQRAQSLDSKQVKEQGGKLAEGKRSSSSFSTDRNSSTKQKKLNDQQSNALMFWSGRTNLLLAAERFYQFDGVDWSNSQEFYEHDHRPGSVQIGEATWFYRRYNAVNDFESPFVGAYQEAIKFVNYRSPMIPADAGLSLWNIDMVDRDDFFNVRPDDSIEMTDREHVPDYTVVRFVNRNIAIDKVEGALSNGNRPPSDLKDLPESLKSRVVELADQFADKNQTDWQRIGSVMQHFRTNYKFVRTQASIDTNSTEETSDSQENEPLLEAITPVEIFLDQKVGDDYLFATAAGLVLQRLGYDIRFVTGFYVQPRFSRHSRDLAITKEDVHAWIELNAGNGNWIPLEPTPTYQAPAYQMSLWYLMKLHRAKIAVVAISGSLIAVFVLLMRRALFELWAMVAWYATYLVGDRTKVRWLAALLDMRLKLAGYRRPNGSIPVQWVNQNAKLPDDKQKALHEFFTEADRIIFGRSDRFTRQGQSAFVKVWRGLTISKLKRTNSFEEPAKIARL